MGRAELGQLIDRGALDASGGSQGRLSLAVPAAWARDGAGIEISVPARICCARCDGGGCDSCDRSGAHRAPAESAARTLRLSLPADLTGCVTVRLVRPFGEHAPLEQLLVELRADTAASPGVLRVPPPPSSATARSRAARGPLLGAPLSAPAVLATLAAIAAVVGLLLSR
ncbi:hypothetical protein SOCEGT47_058330 [Sorangium cellulosum]|uniref:Uncharacterized protein n=1 Tax=Sorangium cellulosum TaxID=56 RepID=A0A4P2Q772_SORCE|nr:hypothetical protein [Sorangium cellulosum]AUX25289.1 hypothetical protein SOCEGT47_058330 [Sorangium cellulosum]